MDARTVVITGGNAGLGYACAKAIAESGGPWRVVLACRDPKRAAEAVAKLKAETGGAAAQAMALDLASLASVRAFADALANRNDLPPLRALVCNAGVQIVKGVSRTADGFEMTFGVNHLGHFLLANLVLPRLAPPARIVFVASGTHNPDIFTGMPKPRWRAPGVLARPETDPEGVDESGAAGRARYSTSKLCNVLCTYEMARRLSRTHGGAIAVNAFDPGLMPGSGLARDYGPVQRFAWNFVLPVLRLFPHVNSLEESGRNLARLAIDPGLDGVTGRYIEGKKEIRSSKDSYDEQKAAALWETSAGMVGLL